MLAENVVFNSPILVRPIEGREVCAAIFAQSSATRGSGTYTAEAKLDERTTFLRWVGTMDGHKFESLEIIVDNEQGLIQERTIALRPYPALKLFRDAMYRSLFGTQLDQILDQVPVLTRDRGEPARSATRFDLNEWFACSCSSSSA